MLLSRLTGPKVATIISSPWFFHPVLSELWEVSFLITFWGPKGLYRWMRLPFGVSSAPKEFQRCLQHVLHGLTGVAVIADDILVYGIGKTMEEARLNHNENLVQLLHRAREQHLKLNKDKMLLHDLMELLYIFSAWPIKGSSNMW